MSVICHFTLLYDGETNVIKAHLLSILYKYSKVRLADRLLDWITRNLENQSKFQ